MEPHFNNFSSSAEEFNFRDGSLLTESSQKEMSMEPHFDSLSNSAKDFNFGDGSSPPSLHQHQNSANVAKLADLYRDSGLLSRQFPPCDPEGESPSEDNEFSETVLKYISQMLMEEDMEEKPCMFPDPLALQAAEKSFYEALGEKYPASPDQHPLPLDSPGDAVSGILSDYNGNCSSSSGSSNLADHRLNGPIGEKNSSTLQSPLPGNFLFQSNLLASFNPSNIFMHSSNGMVDPSVSKILVESLFSNRESVLQFQRGVEEASKFLPKVSILTVGCENDSFSQEMKAKASEALLKLEKKEMEQTSTGLTGKKHHERDEVDSEEERSNKQYAVDVDDGDLSEMFDKVLLCCKKDGNLPSGINGATKTEVSKKLDQNEQLNGSKGVKNRNKKQGSEKEVVDLRTLLILCAQAISGADHRTSSELLKQIRQYSSPLGDGSQRLANCFANALEARLTGTGTQIYTALNSKRISAADMLKAYQVYISSCPFKKLAIIFANHTFLKLAEKAATLHIIDFGILCGFQWPALIFSLSNRAGGPPKLRITGIETPQHGFRPAERVRETGRRLARYCERFNVPFEYNGIAQKWENIQIKDLKVRKDEVVAVNCIFRFKYLLDETAAINSPRDAVLNLIRKINPDVFVHSIVNGSYNAPFFVTRFREVLFHYSAFFDMLDEILPREDPMRLMFEKEFCGREIINVVACEGSDRLERPETYKQWQVRNTRAGFRQLPLEPDLMMKLRCKLNRGDYHSDFMIDEDGHWMLQGWKGRILHASSCWVPC